MNYDDIRTYSSNLCKKKYPKNFFAYVEKNFSAQWNFLDKVNFRKLPFNFIKFRKGMIGWPEIYVHILCGQPQVKILPLSILSWVYAFNGQSHRMKSQSSEKLTNFPLNLSYFYAFKMRCFYILWLLLAYLHVILW